MCGALTWNSPQTCSVSMYYGLRLISLSLFIVCCHSWLSDLQFCKRTSCPIHKCMIYLRKKSVERKSVKLCRELLNSRNSNLKSYQITFVLIAIEQVWKLTRGNISSIKNCLQLKHLNDNWLPDWLTSIIKDCLTDWLTKQPIEWLTNQSTDRLVDKTTEWFTDWLSCSWLINWLAHQVTDWLMDSHEGWKAII